MHETRTVNQYLSNARSRTNAIYEVHSDIGVQITNA